jgi:transposase
MKPVHLAGSMISKSGSLLAAPTLATALVASVADPKAFRSGRNFSAWVGLGPKQHSSGGKERLGSISKQGDRYLRSLFTAGALAVIRLPGSMALS